MSKVSVSVGVSLTIAPQTVWTVYRDRVLTVGMVHLANVTAGAITVQLHYVPDGDVAAVANAVLYNFSVAANDFEELNIGHLLLAGTAIVATCSADNAVNIFLSGLEE